MFSQYSFDYDEYLESINEVLKAKGLHQLSTIGGGMGQPFFKDVVTVTEVVPKSVTFTVKFPTNLKLSAHMHGQEEAVTLRFQRDGSMYNGAIVKVYVLGVLWEGEVIADAKEQRIWSVTWKLG